MNVRRLLGAVVIMLAVVPAASGSVGGKPAVTPPTAVYTGIAIGGVDRFRHIGDSKSTVESDSSESYRVRIDFTFTIAADGSTQGTGTGVYTLATWHLQGRNGSQGTFNCMIPITAKPFTVTETMPPRPFPIVEIGLQTPDARETNAKYDCGAGYSGFATDSAYIAESLARVIWHVKFDATHPVFPVLTHDEKHGSATDFRTVHDEWVVSVAPPGSTPTPPTLPPQGPNNGKEVGGGGALPTGDSPAGPTGDDAFACTIKGTGGNDVLVGTSGPDVICGFGGNDRINGGGGDDIIYGGPGNDTIIGGGGSDSLHGNSGNDKFIAKDGQRDLVNGNGGHDTATFDRNLDKLVGIETRRP